MSLEIKCQAIEWIISDVDGVLTDGGVIINHRGEHSVQFHIRDGLGIKIWQRAGKRFGILTGRNIDAVQLRAEQLGVDYLCQGADDKMRALKSFLADHDVSAESVCYLGDDLPDLPVLRLVGLAVTVADACNELRAAADYVTDLPGGKGAVREASELILKSQGIWESCVGTYNPSND